MMVFFFKRMNFDWYGNANLIFNWNSFFLIAVWLWWLFAIDPFFICIYKYCSAHLSWGHYIIILGVSICACVCSWITTYWNPKIPVIVAMLFTITPNHIVPNSASREHLKVKFTIWPYLINGLSNWPFIKYKWQVLLYHYQHQDPNSATNGHR